MKARILVVEDDPRHLRLAQISLEAAGYEVLTATDGMQAINQVASEAPDLVLLDVRLPDMDGFAVCERVRAFSQVPIIMVTALTDVSSKVRGLDVGADDYLTKPFSVQELLARVRAVMRRSELSKAPDGPPSFTCGELKIDFVTQRVFVRGQEVALTPIEYKLLSLFVRNAGRVLTPQNLLQAVWGDDSVQGEQLVWQAVHRLRRKIEPDPKQPLYIHNRPGIGYYFECVT